LEEKVVIDTIDRITKLMDKHWDANSITELTDEKKNQIQEFIKKELEDIEDTYCESVDHLKLKLRLWGNTTRDLGV
jgi:hypothetical protein